MDGSEMVVRTPIESSPEHGGDEQSPGQAFVGELALALLNVSEEPDYAPDRARQLEVLGALPSDILLELAAHLRCVYLEQQKFARLRGVPLGEDEFDDESVLRGKVFELLVGADRGLHTPNPIADEILALMHDPERFGLSHVLGHFRTPDAAYLAVDQVDDVLVVRAIAEAKLGKLNNRALHQLSERGFRYGLEQMAACVNELGDLKHHGLKQIAAFIHATKRPPDHPRLMVAMDVHQILVVPANRDISDPASFIRASDFDDLSYGQLLYLLTDSDHLTIKTAAFSTAEVAAITDYFYEKLTHPTHPGVA